MKKYLGISYMLYVSGIVLAQIDKLVGNWIEKRHSKIETIASGFVEMNKD